MPEPTPLQGVAPLATTCESIREQHFARRVRGAFLTPRIAKSSQISIRFDATRSSSLHKFSLLHACTAKKNVLN